MNAGEKINSKQKLFDNLFNAYVLIFIIMILAAVATYVIPAGAFDRVIAANGKEVVDPSSYHHVAQNGTTLMSFLMAIPRGMQASGSIIFFVFIVAGAFELLAETGFTTALVNITIRKFAGKERLLIPIIVTILSFFAATMGMADEVIIFVPIFMALSKQMGYDELFAAGLAYCGIRAGHINGMMNPFNVGIAQGFAELPMYSGLWYRSIWCVITVAITSYLLYRYAQRIKNHPEKSLMYGVNADWGQEDLSQLNHVKMTGTQKVIGIALAVTFAILIFGVAQFGWYLDEIAAVFLAFGILIAVIARYEPIKMINVFLRGAKSVLTGALIIGVARGILVILTDGNLVDAITFYAAEALKGTSKVITANGMYVFQWLLNLIIPSGSAQAATTMPIMVPVADVLGINRQVAVLAFHYGDGVTNLLTPACGPLMTTLAVAKVPYQKWVKWIVPMLLAWTVIGFLAVTIGQIINLGPF